MLSLQLSESESIQPPLVMLKNLLKVRCFPRDPMLVEHYYNVLTLRKVVETQGVVRTAACVGWRYEWGIAPGTENLLDSLIFWSKITNTVGKLNAGTHGHVRNVVLPYVREVYDILMSGLIQYYIAFPELVTRYAPHYDKRKCPFSKDTFDAFVARARVIE